MPWMTIPIALAIAGGASAGAQVYSTRSAGKTNRRSIEASERSEATAARLESDRLAEERRALDVQLAERKAERDAKLAQDDRRWQDYLRVNEPFWRAGSGIVGSLYDLAGMGGQAPAYASPSGGPPAPGQGVTGAPPMGGPPTAGPLSDLMTSGTTRGAPPIARPSPLRRGSPPSLMAPSAPQPISLQQLMMLSQMMGDGTPSPVAHLLPR